jgi:large subunit ribosomal protein L1
MFSSSCTLSPLLRTASTLCGRATRRASKGQRLHQIEYRAQYVSQAHPRPVPEHPVNHAMQMVLEGVEERKINRVKKWERNAPKRQAKGLKEDGPYRNQDETVELAINLNLDPRRPGQALRGSLLLPHGTGKQIICLVLTNDTEVAKKAKAEGHHAGGEELLEQILSGEIPLDTFQRALCTKDILPAVQKKAARLLGPRGLMPNAKTNTVFDEGSTMLETLQEQSNTITYRTESSGIVHFPIGKSSFESHKLLDNLQAICQTIQDLKPETFGRGKKKKKMGKNVKYWMRAHLTSTQGKGVRMDLRTVDPTSPFFMKDPE